MREVIDANYVYLTNHTNYLSRSAIARCVSTYFEDYSFCESSFLKCSDRGRIIQKLSQFLPLLPGVDSMLRALVLFLHKGWPDTDDLPQASCHIR